MRVGKGGRVKFFVLCCFLDISTWVMLVLLAKVSKMICDKIKRSRGVPIRLLAWLGTKVTVPRKMKWE